MGLVGFQDDSVWEFDVVSSSVNNFRPCFYMDVQRPWTLFITRWRTATSQTQLCNIKWECHMTQVWVCCGGFSRGFHFHAWAHGISRGRWFCFSDGGLGVLGSVVVLLLPSFLSPAATRGNRWKNSNRHWQRLHLVLMIAGPVCFYGFNSCHLCYVKRGEIHVVGLKFIHSFALTADAETDVFRCNKGLLKAYFLSLPVKKRKRFPSHLDNCFSLTQMGPVVFQKRQEQKLDRKLAPYFQVWHSGGLLGVSGLLLILQRCHDDTMVTSLSFQNDGISSYCFCLSSVIHVETSTAASKPKSVCCNLTETLLY